MDVEVSKSAHVTVICTHNNAYSSIQGPHGVVDGRGCLSLFDQLLTSLNQSLTEGENVTDIGLDWGEETERLCGAGSVLTGEFDALASNEAVPAAVPPPGFVSTVALALLCDVAYSMLL